MYIRPATPQRWMDGRYLNFVGMETRKAVPWLSTTWCRLFPFPATTFTMLSSSLGSLKGGKSKN